MKSFNFALRSSLLVSALALGGCQMKQKILDAGAVSMTRSSIQPGETLKEKGPVAGTFCSSSDDKGTIGLMDEAVKTAQKENSVDYITNASFYIGPKPGCMMVEGTGNMIVTASAPSAPEAPLKSRTKAH
jgi:hypothetical protein